jgi:hypothetical protein
MATTVAPQRTVRPVADPQVIVYGHSSLLYWWPVWVAGYIMAGLTWLHPIEVQFNGMKVLFNAQANVGIIFSLIVLFTVLITTTHMRGLASLLVIVCAAFVGLFFAYLDWWPSILHWFGQQAVYMDRGFYLFFSTGLLLVWAAVVLIFDHLSFWRIRPGQVTHEYVLGAMESSYDTDSIVFSKQQSDLFRNWILGLGSGDLQMQTMGGRGIVANVSNVMFLNSRMARIQALIATKPDVPQQA